MEFLSFACLGAVGLTAALALRKHPRILLTLWLMVMTAVPVWLEARIGATFPPLSLLFLVMVPAILRVADRRVTKSDLLVIAFLMTAGIATFAGNTPMYAMTTALIQWAPAYLVGRHLALAAGKDWVYKALAIATGIVGGWALIEFAFDLHVFEDFAGTTSMGGWQTIQVRGPYARSEGAFGHSIALGAFLALGLPFVLAANIKPLSRILLLVATAGGLIVTFSRGPLLGGLIVAVLSVTLMASDSMSKKLRGWALGLLVVAGFTVLPFILNLFEELSYDTEASTGYRELLYQTILEDMNPLGPAEGFGPGPGGRYFYWYFASIDNTYVLSVLQYGWLPIAFLLVGLLALFIRVVLGSGGPADIAMVGQIWVMFTVALITQYGMAVWFIAGMAVAFGSRKKPRLFRKKALPHWAGDRGAPAVLSDARGPQAAAVSNEEDHQHGRTGTPNLVTVSTKRKLAPNQL